MLLPGAVAHHGDGRRGGLVIVGSDDASGKGPDAEHGEIISGDEFSLKGLGGTCGAAAANAQARQRRLEGGHIAEFRRVVPELLIKIVRVEIPVILHPVLFATIVRGSDAVELIGTRHRQALEHDRVHEREDGRVRANA